MLGEGNGRFAVFFTFELILAHHDRSDFHAAVTAVCSSYNTASNDGNDQAGKQSSLPEVSNPQVTLPIPDIQ